MKKGFLLIAFLSFLVLAAFGDNNKAELFKYDKEELESEFSELNQLEYYVNNHKDFSINEIKTFYNVNGFSGLNDRSGVKKFSSGIERIDWNSFAMGLLCCPYGALMVFSNEDRTKDQVKSFWYGAIGFTVWYSSIILLLTPS